MSTAAKTGLGLPSTEVGTPLKDAGDLAVPTDDGACDTGGETGKLIVGLIDSRGDETTDSGANSDKGESSPPVTWESVDSADASEASPSDEEDVVEDESGRFQMTPTLAGESPSP